MTAFEPLEWEATALPTEPQPLHKYFIIRLFNVLSTLAFVHIKWYYLLSDLPDEGPVIESKGKQYQVRIIVLCPYNNHERRCIQFKSVFVTNFTMNLQ